MAEGSSVNGSKGLEKQLQGLLSRYSGDELGADSEPFCSDFCKLVEEYASRWQVPLPQLRVLEIALRYFSRASTFFTTNCDHVQHTIGSLALSIFELLLYFDQKDFCEEPLKNFTATFQECHLVLAKYQNVYLLQVECLVQDGGPWASPALQAILSDSSLPQNEVDCFISSELPVLFELRVRYLSSCGHVSEAVALAKCCVRHPAARQHLFFHQVYLSWLYKTLQHELLHKEVADINGKDAVHIICSLECEETDKLLLALSSAFLSQQLQRGDMYYLCDLVRVWTNLHSRLNTSKRALLDECRRLMFSATNVKSIFPFIRAILQEVGEDGIQFCVELCANALQSCLPCDVLTKALIYKTIAALLPNDLEVSRACALLVFFLERTVESYKIVYLLYMIPDQEYPVDDSPIGNNVRFETLQVLKKDLPFDPEFWNLIALRTNCLKLLSEKVVSAALEEIMEDKWISKYCAKEPALRSRLPVCHRGARDKLQPAAKKRHHPDNKLYKKDSDSKRLRMGAGKTRLNDHSLRRRGKESSSGPLRRSFWQLDRIHSSLTLRYDDHRRTTRLSEKNLPKRKIKKPRWLLEDSGALEENVPLKMKKNGLRQKKHLRSCVMKRPQAGQDKNAKLKSSVKTLFKARENSKYQNGFSLDCSKPTPTPQVVLELSLPDNELMDTFVDDACSKPRIVPQVLLYKRTVKFPDSSPPGKTVHGKEVILRARDANMLIQQLHCYARRQKGKGNGSSIHGSVSTITRSSVQGSPSKDSAGEPVCELKVCAETGAQVSNTVLKDQNTKAELQKTSSAGELSKRTEAKKITEPPDLHNILQRRTTGKVLQSNARTRDPPENSSAEVEGTAAANVTEGPRLCDVSQAKTAGEPFEEPTVEMKVTIASQSPVLNKVSKSPTEEEVSKAQVSQTTKAVKNKKKATDEIHPVSMNPNISNTGASDPLLSNCRDVALESRDNCENNSAANSNTISTMDVAEDLRKNPQVNVPWKNDTSPVKNVVHPRKPSETEDSRASPDKAKTSGPSAPTVTDLAPEELDQDQVKDEPRTPGSRTSKDSSGGSQPKAGQKIPSTSSCSVPEQEVSVVDRGEKKVKATQDALSDIPENIELMETLPEPEESKLEHYCTFCNKDFKGSRVVEHAMFHYRKDECTFCRLIFKDDLLAMMHLSDHIEKLKRCKDQDNGDSVTKDTSSPKTSAKAKTTNMPSGCQGKEKGRKISVCSESIIDASPSESRTLRSNHKQTSDASSHEKQKSSKHSDGDAAAHRVNGHIGKKTEMTRLKKDLDKKEECVQRESSQRKHEGAPSSRLQRKHLETDSSVQTDKDLNFRENKRKKELPKNLKTTSVQNVEKKTTEPEEKLCCPMDGCSWFTDLSKNRVTLLYHALEKHYGENEPLELAFRVSDNKCSICMRVLCSFEHFQHHVRRHRLVPRHPCLHRGCTERFKTGMEMRRHARKHNPLQATCCLPGCSQLFICLWALNLHEREHYSSKSVKPEKNTNVETGDKLCKTPVSKKPQFSEDDAESAAGNGTESIKAAQRLREQATNDRTRNNVADPAVSASRRSLKNKLKVQNDSEDLKVLTNLSNKDTSGQPSVSNPRLRQISRKVQVTNRNPDAPRVHKVISSSLLKYSSKLRCKLKKRQRNVNTKGLIRREGPSKVNKATHDEKTTAGQKLSSEETVNKRRVSDRIKVEKEKNQNAQGEINASEKANVSKSKISEGKPITRNKVLKISSSNSLNQSERQKSNGGKIFHKVRNHHHAPLDSSKSKNVKVNKKPIRIGRKQSQTSASKKPARPKPSAPQKAAKRSASDELKTEVEDQDSAQNSPGGLVLATPPGREETVKAERREAKISLVKEEQKTASTNSGKAAKKSKGLKKTFVERHPSESKGKTSTSKSISKSKSDPKQQEKAKGAAMILQGLQRLIKSTLDEKEKRKEASRASAPSSPTDAANKTCSSSGPEDDKPEVDKSEKCKKSSGEKKKSEAGKVRKKRKNVCKDDAKKVAKKKRKVCDRLAKPSSEAQLVGESSDDTEDTNPSETSSSVVCGCSQTLNREALSDDVTFIPCKETLAKYSKKPYMRLPPTAYLDEKFITMPKRRKELLLHRCPVGAAPEPASVKTAQQRHRCANCFATFSSTEELRGHVERQKCSNLFGFDSDDEGNS
ncbi:uncharacterized protein LOC108245010 isoform X2 [Kryptolebias marmoratus]|uniref:uncharacterized protein LOC108245010 isoform X2 n=1 Tax=Kryptolebias marmoratus TaxID=37003 RepID=UPI0007F93716|nr:uncharacterized protein LOC108245010 isoform X2 [Kryptolebias marmoratus]